MSLSIWFDKNLLRSPAFRGLKKWAILVYLDFLRKRQMEKVKQSKRSDLWHISNNGEIVYPYSEAEKKGIGRREFRTAFDELIEKGFLDITRHGSGGRSGDMTKYFIDVRWKDYGTPEFRPPVKPRNIDTRKGRGWSVYHGNKKKASVTKLIPEQADSSSSLDTPKVENKVVSNNKSDTPKRRKVKATTCKIGESQSSRQLSLWSDNFDTIL
jgi:hypothetical protein